MSDDNVVSIRPGVLSLSFDVTSERMNEIVSRANRLGRKGRIDFEILICAPDGTTLELTSTSTGPMETVKSEGAATLCEALSRICKRVFE